MPLINLPNEVPTPNANNLTAEANQYYNLYTSLNRTTTGYASYSSPSSGRNYSTNDYSSDADVYNKGQTGLMNLLYKYVLNNYIINAESINVITGKVNSSFIDVVTASYDESTNSYLMSLSYAPATSVYSIRFRAPNDYIENSMINIAYQDDVGDTYNDICTPVLSGSSSRMPAGTFVTGRIITANVDRSSSTITFDSSATSPLIISANEPTSDSDKNKLWLNTNNGVLNYWNGTAWVGVVGVWGA